MHVLWPAIEKNTPPGDLVFPSQKARTARIWLQIALAVRGVPDANLFALHSLRRGPARELVNKGGSLAVILKAGGWHSSAFQSYLDLVGLGRKVFAAGADALIDLGQEED